MNTNKAFTPLFTIAALYDAVLGIAFLVAGGPLFKWLDITPPNHMGYVQFPAALLIVFAAMFAAIAKNPSKNRNLIPYGILLKISYCGVVLFHWVTTDLPWIWKPFFVFDLLFLLLFIWAWNVLRKQAGH